MKPVKLIILAGNGNLPSHCCQIATASGYDPVMVSLLGGAKGATKEAKGASKGAKGANKSANRGDKPSKRPASPSSLPNLNPPLHRLLDTLEALKAQGYRHITAAGGLPRTTTVSGLAKNRQLGKFITHKLSRFIGGDDFLLRNAFGYLRLKGFTPVPQQRLLKPLLGERGALTVITPTPAQLRSIGYGIKALRAMSKFDIGQALALEGNNIVAVEGSEGTDKMLQRSSRLGWKGTLPTLKGKSLKGKAGTTNPKGGLKGNLEGGNLEGGLILVKAMKQSQSKYADLPSMGVKTIQTAAKAGFRGIALHKVLIIDKPKALRLANKHKLFVWSQ